MSKSTAVVKSKAALPAAVANLAVIGQNAAATTGDIGTGDAFGKFTKAGTWEFGQENIEVQDGSQWALNPLSMRHGYIHWPDEGRPTEVMVPLTDPLPPVDSLPDVDGDWGKTFSFQARCLNGEDEGQQVIFKGSSMGFLKASTKIAQAIGGKAIAGESDVVPTVELEAGHYTHKSYGKIFTPDLKVVGWTTLEGEAEAAEEAVEEDPPADEAETKKEKAKPARRRRKRVA